MFLIVIINKIQESCRHSFVPNKRFGQFLDVSPKNLLFSKTFDSEFSYTELLFTDQNSNPLEVEDKTNITLVIK